MARELASGVSPAVCRTCHGRGTVKCWACDGRFTDGISSYCHECADSGLEDCPRCGPDSDTLDDDGGDE